MSTSSNKSKLIQQNVISKIPQSKIFQPWGDISHSSPLYRVLRRRYLGASEVACAANALGAYNSRNRLRLKKSSLAAYLNSNNKTIADYLRSNEKEAEDTGNPALEWGNFHEIFARSEFVDLITNKLMVKQIWADPTEYLAGGGLWINPEDQRYSCSPDGIFFDKFGVLEPVVGKLREMHGLFGDYNEDQRMWLVEYKCPFKCQKYDVIPNNHRCQLLAQMAATGIHKVLYCVYVPGQPLDVHVAIFDHQEWTKVKKESDDFLLWLTNPQIQVPKRFGNKLIVDLKSWLISDKDTKCIFGFC